MGDIALFPIYGKSIYRGKVTRRAICAWLASANCPSCFNGNTLADLTGLSLNWIKQCRRIATRYDRLAADLVDRKSTALLFAQ
jgi:hypothetical protein